MNASQATELVGSASQPRQLQAYNLNWDRFLTTCVILDTCQDKHTSPQPYSMLS